MSHQSSKEKLLASEAGAYSEENLIHYYKGEVELARAVNTAAMEELRYIESMLIIEPKLVHVLHHFEEMAVITEQRLKTKKDNLTDFLSKRSKS